MLGISQESSEEEIKAAFRRIAREFHPDTCCEGTRLGFPDFDDIFRRAKDAMDALLNEEVRGFYQKTGCWRKSQFDELMAQRNDFFSEFIPIWMQNPEHPNIIDAIKKALIREKNNSGVLINSNEKIIQRVEKERKRYRRKKNQESIGSQVDFIRDAFDQITTECEQKIAIAKATIERIQRLYNIFDEYECDPIEQPAWGSRSPTGSNYPVFNMIIN